MITLDGEVVKMHAPNFFEAAWVKVTGMDFSKRSAKKFSARIASDGNGGAIELRLGGPDGKLMGTCKMETTPAAGRNGTTFPAMSPVPAAWRISA